MNREEFESALSSYEKTLLRAPYDNERIDTLKSLTDKGTEYMSSISEEEKYAMWKNARQESLRASKEAKKANGLTPEINTYLSKLMAITFISDCLTNKELVDFEKRLCAEQTETEPGSDE